MEQIYEYFLWAMSVVAAIVFVSLYFVNAGYGMMINNRWGWTIPNKLGWVLMEAPVFVGMTLLWWFSDRRYDTAVFAIFLIFQLHYFQRSFIFPLLMRGKSRIPVAIVAMGVLFNLLNASMQGGWLFYFSPVGMYQESWLCSGQFIIGVTVFFAGMAINIKSDSIIRNLRKPGDTRHYIPKGGAFRYVTSANYFGELVEWSGFAIMCASPAGWVFVWWTFANLVPRANTLHKKYISEFGEEYTKLKRKRIIPFIY